MIERSNALDAFSSDNTVTVMLASISAIAEGYVNSGYFLCDSYDTDRLTQCAHRVNFTAANVVHLMEPQWNPMVEEQAIDRVHRIGQLRSIAIYRYIVRNSIESVSLNNGYCPWLPINDN